MDYFAVCYLKEIEKLTGSSIILTIVELVNFGLVTETIYRFLFFPCSVNCPNFLDQPVYDKYFTSV